MGPACMRERHFHFVSLCLAGCPPAHHISSWLLLPRISFSKFLRMFSLVQGRRKNVPLVIPPLIALVVCSATWTPLSLLFNCAFSASAFPVPFSMHFPKLNTHLELALSRRKVVGTKDAEAIGGSEEDLLQHSGVVVYAEDLYRSLAC